MATIARVRFVWTGGPVVGGGVSTFFTTNLSPATFTTALRTFFISCAPYIPNGVTITPPAGGDLIDATSGALNGAWSMTQGSTVTSSGAAQYAAGTGMRVTWQTAGVHNRRRVRGTTYIVPMVAGLWDTDGTITNSAMATISAAASLAASADGGSMCVWSRPKTKTSNDGAFHPVIGGSATDRTSWLRSRRT